MGELKIGDIVARKSYGQDIFFKVACIRQEDDKKIIVLKGICYRIEADAPEEDLIIQTEQDVRKHNMAMNRMMENKYSKLAVAGRRDNKDLG